MPAVGDSLSFDYVVTAADLASALPVSDEDRFPPVFATARMIALMELAAARLMKPGHGADELSVGVGVDVRHLAATPEGETVTAAAEYLGQEGKLHRFRVTLTDASGLAGEGEHTRAVVATERLMAGIGKRR